MNVRLEPVLKGKPLPHITRADMQAIIDAIPAQHREEVAGLTWAELDRSTTTWTILNGKAHIVPLAPSAVGLLDGLALAVQRTVKTEEPEAKKWPKSGPV